VIYRCVRGAMSECVPVGRGTAVAARPRRRAGFSYGARAKRTSWVA
jgi:hypothetical protein